MNTDSIKKYICPISLIQSFKVALTFSEVFKWYKRNLVYKKGYNFHENEKTKPGNGGVAVY